MGLAEDPNKAIPIPKKLLVRKGLAGTAPLWGRYPRSTGQVALDKSLAVDTFLILIYTLILPRSWRGNELQLSGDIMDFRTNIKKPQSISWDLPEAGGAGNAAAKLLLITKKGSLCTAVPAWPICIRGQRFQVKGGPTKVKEKAGMTLFAICLHSHSVSQLSASPTSRFNGTSKALLKPAGISCPLQPCRSSLEFWEQCMGTENSSKWAFLHLSFLCYNSGDGSGKRWTAARKENSAEAVCGEWSVLHLGFS